MSMSGMVFSKRHLETVGEWQTAIKALGFDLILDDEADRRIDDLGGHLPARWEGQEAGFECDTGDADSVAETVEMYPEHDFGGPWTCTLDLIYRGVASVAGVNIAAAAYAYATEGVYWEGESGTIYDAPAAIEFARSMEIEVREDLARPEA